MKKRPSAQLTKKALIALLAALLLAAFFASFCLGRLGVPPLQSAKILLSKIFPIEPTWDAKQYAAVMNIRLPRIALACLVGCCLSAAGAAFQGVFCNPMAAPDILGASSGAAFGAALAIFLGFSSRGITLTAFAFSLCTIALVFLIALRAPGQSTVNLILAGVMLSSLCSAATSYIKLVADPTNQLPSITYWLMGSLSGARLSELEYAVWPMALGLIPLFLLRWRLNILTLGDSEARALGVNAKLLRLAVILCASFITAASVSVSGMIGWVGLVIPHIARKLVGSDYRALLPASMLAGAAFLLIVDDVSRTLLAVEIPIGILTAFVGAPFFIYLLLRREKTL